MTFAQFCKAIGFAPEPFQRRIADAALKGPTETLCLLPRGCGKSRLLAAIALYHLVTDA